MPYDDLAVAGVIAEHHKNAVAVMLEIVQGEGGINIADADYQRGLRAFCDAQGWSVAVRRGAVRHGAYRNLVRFQHAAPSGRGDVGQGWAAACRLARASLRAVRPASSNPVITARLSAATKLACAAALTTLAVVERDQLIDNAQAVGELIRRTLADALAGTRGSSIFAVRA